MNYSIANGVPVGVANRQSATAQICSDVRERPLRADYCLYQVRLFEKNDQLTADESCIS
jgi:hypothetical protein